jgi:hypothetical protein
LGLFLGWALVSALASEGFGSFALPKLPLAVVLRSVLWSGCWPPSAPPTEPPA